MNPILVVLTSATKVAPAIKTAALVAPKFAPGTPPSLMSALASSLLALVLVVALILAMAWLLRRLPGHGMASGAGLRLVTSLNVGVKERVLVIDVGGEHLLIGVASGAVELLYKLPQPLPEPTVTATFPTLLMKRLRAPGKTAEPSA